MGQPRFGAGSANIPNERCPTCHGSKKVPDDSQGPGRTKKCPTCNGRGCR